MNERIEKLAEQSGLVRGGYANGTDIMTWRESFDNPGSLEKFAELIMQDMHRKVIASILITDVVMEERGQVPTSEDYIAAINKDFGVES